MTSTNLSFAASSSTYLDSLVNYVLDVKPYHSKLAAEGAISEKYLFSDNLQVSIAESENVTIFLGADLLPATAIPGGNRARHSQSWWHDIVSDGHKSTWSLPQFSNPVFASSARLQNFTCGINDYTGIPGITLGAFNPKRWDGPGITDVRKNNIHQQDTIDYTLSHGAYVVDVLGGGNWIENDINGITAFNVSSGALVYDSVARAGGTINNIVGGNYQEWVITTTFVDPAGILPAMASVMSNDQLVGTVTFNQSFVTSSISFFWGPAPGETVETTEIGDVWVLTPLAKITVNPSAPQETWSIIKSNPIALAGQVLFNSMPMVAGGPALEVHTRSLEYTNEEVVWTVQFNGDGTYTLSRSALTNPNGITYPLTVSLINGCSFKNTDISFTIIPTVAGWNVGDTFSWTTSAFTSNFKVYGSVSGWQPDAVIGQWYWNGKIGFKIPALTYFTSTLASTIATSAVGIDGTWFNEVQNTQILTSVTYQNGGFYAAGDDSIVAASADGLSWTSDIASIFTPAPFSNEMLIVTGENGLVAASTDGITWGIQQTNVTVNLIASTQIPNFLATLGSPVNNLNCIIVVGNAGTIITSINATAWAIQTSGTLANLNAITWTNLATIPSPDTRAIIVVGQNGTILRSTDRIVWAKIASGVTANLNAVVYEPLSESLIIVGDGGTILRSTDNGQTWANLNQFSDGDLDSVAYGDGEFVAVGRDGWTARSSDGIIWVRYSGRAFNGIAYGNGRFVAVGGTANQYTNFTPLKPVSSMAESSVYLITFTQASTDTTPGYATVYNNIYGYRAGLITGQPWADEFCSFQIDTVSANIQFNVGDQIQVFLSPAYTYAGSAAYEINPYEISKYDAGSVNLTVPYLYNTDLFPMYRGYGAVIWHGNTGDVNGNCVVGDSLIIDKAFYQEVQLQITGVGVQRPELGAVNDWLPLELRYYDNATGSLPYLTPTSNADFSDPATYIEAYSASNPNQLVFSIYSPRYQKTNRSAVSTLTFDPTFFSTYLPFNTQYSIKITPDESYGQHIRVKVTENLKIYGRINLDISDPIMVVVVDGNPGFIEIVAEIFPVDLINVSIAEGGALPVFGYNELPYGVEEYDIGFPNGVITGVTETSPGVYNWTGNPSDWVMPYPTTSPSFYITDNISSTVPMTGVPQQPTAEIGNTSIGDGLSIQVYHTTDLADIYLLAVTFDFNLIEQTTWIGNPPENEGLLIPVMAASYEVTVINLPFDPTTHFPTFIVESTSNLGTYGTPSPSFVFTPMVGATSASYTFTLPGGFTAPFRLWVV